MKSLFSVTFNWNLFAGIAFLIIVLFPGLSWFSYFALLITLHQFFLLFYSFGYIIPIRYLFGAFMCLQMLLGPLMAYNGLDSFQRSNNQMQIPEAEYFSYVIPAVVCFILSLHVSSKRLMGEFIDMDIIKSYTERKKELPYILIAIGFVASLMSEFISSELAFVFYLLGSFKYVGAFMLIYGNVTLKVIPLIVVYGSIIFSSLGDGMFHDLLTWLIFLGAALAIKFKPKVYVKFFFVLAFILLSVAIQMLKGDYRKATWERGEESGINTLSKAYEQSQSDNMFFSSLSLAQSNLRINQGYIITHIMKTVPKKIPYQEGTELNDIIIAAIFPRFLVPDKLSAGDRDIFMKYTGMPLRKGTSMALSSVGDAYINFGIIGGCLFMFLLGLLYSEVLNVFFKLSKTFPMLILFIPMVYYYPIRPDCELQTTLGHLVKSCMLIFVVFIVWKSTFRFRAINFFNKSPV